MFAASKTAAVSGAAPDSQFNYVTMLLHGDGTNGAQNNTFLDSSSNAFSITRNGNTTQGSFSPYGSNWSNYFDGSSYLTTSSTQIIPTGSFTVECYVFVTGSGNNQKFVSQGSSGSAGRFSLGIEGGNWFVQLGGDLIQTGTPVKNQWNYVATTYNGSTITMYVNGSSIGTVSSTANAQNAALTIGQDWNAYTLSGYVSNVRVSNTVRTITTPTAPYTSDANTRLLTCQSNRFIDNSANAFTLTTNGAPSVQRFNPFGASTAYSTSVIGGSGYFDGSGDYLTVADNAALDVDAGDFTMEAWVYFPDASVTSPVLAKGFGSAGGWMMWVQSTLRLRMYDAGGSSVTATSSASLTSNSWNHVAATRSGNTLTVYVNGVSSGTATFTGTSTNASVLEIGGYGSATAVSTGYISNARLVKGTAVYTGNFTPSTTPLTAISGTSLLTSMTNGAIYDNAMMNDLETVGNAQISTSVYKYGTGSLAFDGTGDWLTSRITPSITLPASGDFTIECWFRANNFTTNVGAIYSNDVGDCYLAIRNAVIEFGLKSGYQYTYTIPSPSTSTWYHLALCRSGSTCYVFLNGTAVITQTGATVTDSFLYGTTLYIGNYAGNTGAGYSYNGYIDEFRITKGYCRYTTTFTPATAAFSDKGPN